MGCKGLIEIRGGESLPLMQPFAEVDGQSFPLKNIRWQRLGFWVPAFTCSAGPIELEGSVLAPRGERGFAFQLRLRNSDASPHQVCFGLHGCWGSAWHCVNEDKQITGTQRCHESLWNNSLIFEMSCGTPLFAFAPMSSDGSCQSAFAREKDGLHYKLSHLYSFEPGQSREAVIYWGFGYEEVAAATSAKEMLRQGWQQELGRTLQWLAQRSADLKDAKLTALYNTCLLYTSQSGLAAKTAPPASAHPAANGFSCALHGKTLRSLLHKKRGRLCLPPPAKMCIRDRPYHRARQAARLSGHTRHAICGERHYPCGDAGACYFRLF